MPVPLQSKIIEDETNMVEQKAKAFDLISDFTTGTPFKSEIAWVSRPAFPSGRAAAKAMNTSSSLVHRALGDRPHLLQTIVSSPAAHNSKPHVLVTAQLEDANKVLNSLVPANSAHVRKTSYTIDGLYRKYSSTLNSNLPPVNEEYFRQLVHQLHITCNIESQACPICDLWNSSDKGASLSADQYGLCEAHFRTKEFQVDSYYNFMDELKHGTFGTKMFGKISSGSLIVFDFGQLDPSSKRHKDGCMHLWWAKPGSDELRSIPIHYVGDDASLQPASVGFVIGCIRHCCKLEEVQNLELIVFFTDGGSKEFNSDLIASLPSLEEEVGKRIVWNYWASNHGAGVSDSDQQNARSSLKSELPERKVINDAAQMVDIINEKQPGAKAFNASQFPRHISVNPIPNSVGISQYHCFIVEAGSIIGFKDSWNMSDRRNFSLPFKSKSKQQENFKARYDAGINMSYCEGCDWYYVDNHTCRSKNEASETSEDDNDVETKIRVKHKGNNKRKKKDELEQERDKDVHSRAGAKKRKMNEDEHKKIKNDELKVDSRVRVWYQEKEKYYTGSITKIVSKDLNTGKFICVMSWDDRRCKKNEELMLMLENRTDDESNDDRWNFID